MAWVHEPAEATADGFAFFRAFFWAARFFALAGSEVPWGVPDLEVPGVLIPLIAGEGLGPFERGSPALDSSP